MKERLKTVEYKKMTEEEQAFWDWWREIGGTQLDITPMDLWLAGVKWERERLKSFHDTPEV